MSTTALGRPHYTALAVAATVGIVYLAFRSYQSTEPPRRVGLHRSNAIRHRRPARRRRLPQWEVGDDQGAELSAEDLAPHIDNARTRPLGQYQNEVLFPFVDGLNHVNLDLVVTNLIDIRDELVNRCSREWPHAWNVQAVEALEDHISAQFVLNLLSKAVDTWSLSPDSVRMLVSTLGELDIHPRVTYRILLLGQSGNLQPYAWTFDPTEVLTVPLPPLEGAGNGGQSVVDHSDGDRGRDGDEDDDDERQPIHVPQEDWDDTAGSPYMLGILYSISRDKAKREGYIHRGIECNSCGVCPIRGVRYHCSNCFDYDLCETCEANQVHVVNHIFYKIRVPAPSRGPIKQVLPKWYPGNPIAFPTNLPRAALERLKTESSLDITEIQALYDQFSCLGGAWYPDDPCEIGMAIDRKGFDLYFMPGESDKLGPSKLIYDRIFAFYDRNGDGLIDFGEFVRGLSDLQDNSRHARLRRILYGYDIDGDGYVSRRDFLRIFRAYYDLSRHLNHEMMASQEEFGGLDEEIREVVDGSQPLSAAFGGSVFYGHQSRAGVDKSQAANGDLLISSGPNDVLQDDQAMHGDRERAIGNVAVGHRPRPHLFRTFRQDPPEDEQLLSLPMPNNFELLGIQHADDATEADLNSADPPLHAYGWPPLLPVEPADITSALESNIPFEEINDPIDRSRVIYAQSQRLDAETDHLLERQREKAVNERWKRRQFYLDEEEGMTKPATYDHESDVSVDGESPQPEPELKTTGGSRSQSLRSRSSSKVRFDDSAIDTDYETRSNASSRGVPVNERWGGYELSSPGVDVGQDILYQAVQQGFNKLLDNIFLEAENKAMEAQSSRKARKEFQELFDKHKKAVLAEVEVVEKALKDADQLRTDELLKGHHSGDDDDDDDDDDDKQQGFFLADKIQGSGGGADPSIPHVAGRVAVANPTAILESQTFGSQIEVGIVQALEERKLATALTDDSNKGPVPLSSSSSSSSMDAESESESVDADADADADQGQEYGYDPTLPQNMPNEWDNTSGQRHRNVDRPRRHPHSRRRRHVAGRKRRPARPSKETLNTWLLHEAIERENEARGGPGRLSYEEFRWKMQKDDELNKMPPPAAAAAAAAATSGSNKSPDQLYWEQSADLGKMSFIGTWLEIASF